MTEILWSLDELNRFEPDFDHYGSTLENSFGHTGFDEYEHMWRRERVPVALVHPDQIVEDPDEIDMEKVVGIMGNALDGTSLPHVVIIHWPHDDYPYHLIEGRHRLNAFYRLRHQSDRFAEIPAFVAHPRCCARSPQVD